MSMTDSTYETRGRQVSVNFQQFFTSLTGSKENVKKETFLMTFII